MPLSHAAIFGEDDRLNYFEIQQPEISQAALSMPAMISKYRLELLEADTYLAHTEKNRFCSTEKFQKETHLSKCSGVLIAKNKILTAGHCIYPSDCPTTVFVFDYLKKSDQHRHITFKSKQIYQCKNIVAWKNASFRYDNLAEYAVVELDRDVEEPYRPIKIATTGVPPRGSPVFNLSYPAGLPLKLSSGLVRRTSTFKENIWLETNLDVAGGSSGSGLLNSNGELVGILLSGDPDLRSSKSCHEERRCKETGCIGTFGISIETLKPFILPHL